MGCRGQEVKQENARCDADCVRRQLGKLKQVSWPSRIYSGPSQYGERHPHPCPIIGVRRKKDEEAEKDITKQNKAVLVGFRATYVFERLSRDFVAEISPRSMEARSTSRHPRLRLISSPTLTWGCNACHLKLNKLRKADGSLMDFDLPSEGCLTARWLLIDFHWPPVCLRTSVGFPPESGRPAGPNRGMWVLYEGFNDSSAPAVHAASMRFPTSAKSGWSLIYARRSLLVLLIVSSTNFKICFTRAGVAPRRVSPNF